MKKIVISCFALAILLALLGGPAAGQQGYRIIVHQNNPTDSLQKEIASDMFRKKRSKWDHGARVVPVDLQPDSPVREAFSRDVHGRSVSSIVSWWQKQIFSGKDTPPDELSSDAAVVDFVRRTPGAIGYVSSGANLSGVKVLVMGG